MKSCFFKGYGLLAVFLLASVARAQVTYIGADKAALKTAGTLTVTAVGNTAQDDLMVLFYSSSDTPPITSLSGWTTIMTKGPNDINTTAFYRKYNSGDSKTINLAVIKNAFATVVTLRGVNLDDPVVDKASWKDWGVGSQSENGTGTPKGTSYAPGVYTIGGGMLLCGYTWDDPYANCIVSNATVIYSFKNGDDGQTTAYESRPGGGDTGVRVAVAPAQVSGGGNDIGMSLSFRPVVLPPNDAVVTSQVILPDIEPGGTNTVRVTLENSGTNTWTTAGGYSLGSQPAGDNTWGITRVPLPHNVAPGQQVTFNFDIIAPIARSTYNCQWQMIDEVAPHTGWFGQRTDNGAVEVEWPVANLVQNPSFEEDADANSRPDNWGNDSNYSRSGEDAAAGSYSVKGTGSGAIGGIRQTIALTPNTDYTLSVWIRRVAGSTGTMVFDTQDKFDATCQFTLTSADGSWHRYEGSFNSGAETSMTLRTYTESSFSGTFYIDNVMLYDADSVPPGTPYFASQPVRTGAAGADYSYAVSADDSDGDPLTYSAPLLPAWLSFDPITQILSGMPAPGDAGGTHDVTLQVTDGNVPVEQSFSIEVSGPDGNFTLNGSFETGDASGWTKPSPYAVVSLESALHGAYAMKCSAVNNLIQPTSQSVTLAPHTDYNLSVWINYTTGTTGEFVFDTHDTFDGPGQGQFVVTADTGGWKQYTGSFNSGDETALNLRLFAVTDTGLNGTVYVDRVTLIPADYVAPPVDLIPNVINLMLSAGETALTDAGYAVGTVTTNVSGTVTPGHIMIQDPSAGTTAPTGTVVNLVVAKAAPPVTEISWSPSVSGNWTDGANWSGGTAPIDQSQNLKVLFKGEDPAACVLDTAASVVQLNMGYNDTTANGNKLVLTAGASLTCGLDAVGAVNNMSVGFNRAATVTVEAGASIDFKGDVWFGLYAPSVSTLNLDGGTVRTEALFGLGAYGGTGYINIRNGGTLNLATFDSLIDSIQGASVIDLESGSMNIDGNHTSAVNAYIAAGRITAYQGAGSLSVGYELGTDTTTVAAVPMGFEAWAAGWDVDIGTPGHDFDGDEENNAYEYALNGNPTNGLVGGVEPVLVKVDGQLVYIHLKRNDDPSLVYSLISCTNLSDGVWTHAAYTVVGTDAMGGGTDYDVVTNSIPVTAEETFIRLQISNP